MATAAGDDVFGPAAANEELRPAAQAGSMEDGHALASYTEFPCSVAQERFWLLDRLEPGNPSYNVAVRWKLEGHVSTQTLQAAWQEIITRHEVLRTRFLEIEGKPVQRVFPQVPFKLVEIDLGTLPLESRAAEGDRIGLIEARAPFDLENGPMVRVVLLRLGTDTAILLVTTHQIVSDGWSIGVMAREMGAIYAAFRTQAPSPLEPLAIQYGDYALWQLEWLQQRGSAAENEYWSRQLQGVVPFEVHADRPRPSIPTTNGAIASRVLSRELTNKMQALCAEQGVTLFSMAVAGLCATLARYTGKTEIVFGTQVSDRDQVELEPMIGQFVNSLILRNDLRLDPRFSELLQRVSNTIAEALEHKHIPIERLLGMVKAGRAGSSSPPVSVNFIFQKTFIENRQYGEFALVDLPSLPAGAIYDLNFFMVERPDGWRVSCQFNTDQFEAETANRLLGYFQEALISATATPARRISELRLADAAITRGLLARLTGPVLARPHGLSVGTQLTARWSAGAARSSAGADLPAVTCGERRLTFAQLEAEANRCANGLLQRGIAPGQRVGICLERSIELLAAILGSWKVAAACVVLDPADEPKHLQQLVDQSGAALVITSPGGPALTAPGGVVTELAVEPDLKLPLPVTSAPEAAFWLSPREPHSSFVGISHLELADRLECLGSRLGIGADDACLSLGQAAPDKIAAELLLPLMCGARVVIPTATEANDSVRLQHLLKRARVTVVGASRDAWPALMNALPRQQRPAKLICERGIGAELAARLLSTGAEVWAVYGYPETSGSVSVRRIEQPNDLRLLGEPFPNTRFRVLDETLKVPPVGARGHLYVGGSSTAGAEGSGRFIVDPTEGAHGERLFKTDDAARMRPDGLIEIIEPEASQLDSAGRRGVAEPGSADADPGDPVTEQRVASIWEELLGMEHIDPNANFFELGGHSLLAARMLARTEAAFGRRITLAALFRAPSIRGLARLLRSDAREFDFRQMVKLQANGANLPLIAINNTGVYYLLAKRLGPQQPVTSLQVFDPSVKHDSLPDTLEGIAAEYVKLIQRVHPNGPYVLAGWCVAGALAFEIARQLAAANHTVRDLFLIDTWVPRYFARQPLLRRLIGNYSLRLQLAWADWRRFTSGEQTLASFIGQRAIVQKIRALLGRMRAARIPYANAAAAPGPEDYDKWLLEYLQATTNRYEPRTYSGRITLFRSTREPTGWLFDPNAGWASFAAGGIELALVEGNHFTMFQDPGASQMAARMSKLIGRA